MSDVSHTPGGGPARFPGFDVLTQTPHWDPVTTGVVLARIGMAPDIRFFTPAEEAAATALCNQLLHQHDDPRVPIVNQIDARLAEQQTDGWHYEDMPEDGQAWRDSLAGLDADANEQFGSDFVACSRDEQALVVQGVQDAGSKPWHGMDAGHLWSLWTRYACTAFYAHPAAWNEIGFPGPAYPRGYKNPGVDAREPFEVRDTRPQDDPARRSS
ncbi:MAG: gluconate 2-dehydrogenase subunit 3 family protein [Jatrophihabitantaceae bacterium]